MFGHERHGSFLGCTRCGLDFPLQLQSESETNLRISFATVQFNKELSTPSLGSAMNLKTNSIMSFFNPNLFLSTTNVHVASLKLVLSQCGIHWDCSLVLASNEPYNKALVD